MFQNTIRAAGVFLLLTLLLLQQGCASPRDVVRPEKILSMRQVCYDQETYQELSDLWKAYYKVYPSEDAYANWMYATRYAKRGDSGGEQEYERKLLKGLKKYPANPTLLYLASMLHHGKPDDHVARHRLERAVELDPTYSDPWFSLVIQYMEQREREKMNLALRKLLEGGAINDMVMDYNYNMLATLDDNAILITNGDNDTYPGWVLQRIVGFREDVGIVNRSLLNTEWYPLRLTEQGLPPFITEDGLKELRESIILQGKENPKIFRQPGGPFGDTLIVRLIESARKQNRPVYLASTLYHSGITRALVERGAVLGLVARVSPEGEATEAELQRLTNTWLIEYRTAGLDSWQMRYAQAGDAARPLAMNYSHGPLMLIEAMEHSAPLDALGLLVWFTDHVAPLVPKDQFGEIMKSWCSESKSAEIEVWCREHGYIE